MQDQQNNEASAEEKIAHAAIGWCDKDDERLGDKQSRDKQRAAYRAQQHLKAVISDNRKEVRK